MKNKNYSCFSKAFLLVALLCCVSTSSFAYNFSATNDDGVTIYYNLINDSKEAEVTSGDDKYSGVVNIPKTVTTEDGTNMNVTSIGNCAFLTCSSLKSVTIPNSVTSIGEEAFRSCSSLTSIAIPSSVTSIGEGAFLNCSSLTSVTIPNSVTSIGNCAFLICSSLKSVTIPSSVTSIGNEAFRECLSLKEVILLGDKLPDNCGNSAFSYISDDATLYCYIGLDTNFDTDSPWSKFKTIEASVVSLDEGERLSKYITSDNESTITKLRVYGEINSTDITLLKEMATEWTGTLSVLDLSGATAATKDLIGLNAFNKCTKLTSISLPQNVTTIGRDAFYGCSSLISITIPNSVTSIDEWVFGDCSSLTSITIPNSVTSIGKSAFFYCTSLTSVTIPDSVTSIGNGAFIYCSGLTSVSIPNSVTSIGQNTFRGCTNLTSVTIGKSVTSIGEGMFYNCSNLVSVIIPSSVTSIGKNTFSGCSSLTSVTIGKSVTSIGEGAFSNCTKLNEVTLRGKVFPECSSTDVFTNATLRGTLYYRNVLKNASASTEVWKDFENKVIKDFTITIPEGGYATGCFYDDLDFSEKEDIAAYIVSAFGPDENTVLLTRAKKIPAETGFIVTGEVGKEYTIPAATINYVYSNMLVSVLDKTTVTQTDGDYTNYTLHRNTTSNTVAFIRVDAEGEDVPGYKAYLQIPTSAVSTSGDSAEAKTSLGLSFDDDDDTTGISEIKAQSNRTSGETVIYNLNGQRKQSLTKELNIVNGKKIFVK